MMAFDACEEGAPIVATVNWVEVDQSWQGAKMVEEIGCAVTIESLGGDAGGGNLKSRSGAAMS